MSKIATTRNVRIATSTAECPLALQHNNPDEVICWSTTRTGLASACPHFRRATVANGDDVRLMVDCRHPRTAPWVSSGD